MCSHRSRAVTCPGPARAHMNACSGPVGAHRQGWVSSCARTNCSLKLIQCRGWRGHTSPGCVATGRLGAGAQHRTGCIRTTLGCGSGQPMGVKVNSQGQRPFYPWTDGWSFYPCLLSAGYGAGKVVRRGGRRAPLPPHPSLCVLTQDPCFQTRWSFLLPGSDRQCGICSLQEDSPSSNSQ